jgi:hypothetical protein
VFYKQLSCCVSLFVHLLNRRKSLEPIQVIQVRERERNRDRDRIGNEREEEVEKGQREGGRAQS